jgi:hypothetical protein
VHLGAGSDLRKTATTFLYSNKLLDFIIETEGYCVVRAHYLNTTEVYISSFKGYVTYDLQNRIGKFSDPL